MTKVQALLQSNQLVKKSLPSQELKQVLGSWGQTVSGSHQQRYERAMAYLEATAAPRPSAAEQPPA